MQEGEEKKAVLVIDMLNDFVCEGAPLEVPSAREIVGDIKREIENARKENIPIIYICDRHNENNPEFSLKIWPPHAIKGTKGADVIPELRPSESDYVLHKEAYSGFFETKLDELLRRLNIRDLIITGTVTNICILYTAADAVMRGYKVTIPTNCIAGLNKEEHEFALRQMKEVLKAEII